MSPITQDNAYLEDLIKEPRETLDIEIKEWLDLTVNDNCAALAKAIIALANHGGGYILIGFKEQQDGTFRPAKPRPEILTAWSQDNIQSIVAKYVDPGVQCRVLHRASDTSNEKYPIIAVPGGHRVPVTARAGAPDGKKLVPHRTYIRRAGPGSEEPKSAEEWNQLFERILLNRKADLLEAMRSIMGGELPTTTQPTSTRLDQLASFTKLADARWKSKVAELPKEASPRFPLGYYDITLAIEGDFERKSLKDLRDIIRSEVRSHSGWPPFLTISRHPFSPKPADGAVEFWRGPDTDGTCDMPAHHDFWRISSEGLFFTRRGYQEDAGFNNQKPGKFFDVEAPIWRLGEAILEAMYIARAIKAEEANLILRSRWTGLAGRSLTSFSSNGMIWDRHSATENEYEATETIGLSSLPDVLPELCFAILSPLYELFDFYVLPKRRVEESLANLQRNRF